MRSPTSFVLLLLGCVSCSASNAPTDNGTNSSDKGTDAPTSTSTTLTSTSTTLTTTSLGIETVEVKVLGQSGKFSIFSKSAGETDSSKVTVTMDSLYELDSAGEKVGTTGPVTGKHSIETFAPQDFTVSDPERVNISSAPAEKITFKTTVGTIGELSVDVIIVLGHGKMGPDSESWEVHPGDIKWNIEFTRWSFCGGGVVECGQGQNKQMGEFLELSVEIKGKDGTGKQDADSTKKYTLGGGVDLLLTDKVTVDGAEQTMPTGYPKVVVANNKQTYVFRFPKFSTGCVYDPVITFSAADSVVVADPTSAAPVSGSHGSVPAMMLLCFLWFALGL